MMVLKTHEISLGTSTGITWRGLNIAFCSARSFIMSVMNKICLKFNQLVAMMTRSPGRVETSTEFASRVPDTHYPTGTRVLVTVNLVSD